MTRINATALVITSVLAAAGCGSSDEEAAAPAETVTVEKTETERAPAPTPKPKAKKPAAEPDSGGGGGGIPVPNVVGKDHQLAQDTMQAAGFYLLQEEDATGQDRLLLYDRNWVTVSQDPPAGTSASPDTEITLAAKKDGE